VPFCTPWRHTGREGGVIVLLVLNLGTRRMWDVSFTSRPVHPRAKILWMGPTAGVEKPLLPTGNQTTFPRLSRPSLNHYTDWAIPSFIEILVTVALNVLLCSFKSIVVCIIIARCSCVMQLPVFVYVTRFIVITSQRHCRWSYEHRSVRAT
jgi:hypothetical protein